MLTNEEQEICINASKNDNFCTAYISDSVYMARFDKYVEMSSEFECIKEHYLQNGELVAKTYKFPKKRLKFVFKPRTLTEEQKQAARDRLQKARENKKNM